MRVLLTAVAAVGMVCAQQPAETTDADRERISAAIGASYYHADQLQGIDCYLGFDPAALAKRANLPAGVGLE